MDPIASAVLSVLMRWTHILSVITIVGGLLYARIGVAPALERLPAAERIAFGEAVNGRFRQWLGLALFLLVLSGLYNLVTKTNIPPGYHLWFGIKMLLALHIIAVSILLARPSLKQERRNRMMTSVVISGIVVVALSAYLRFLSNWMQS
jgi:uncharacterized membrane protein